MNLKNITIFKKNYLTHLINVNHHQEHYAHWKM